MPVYKYWIFNNVQYFGELLTQSHASGWEKLQEE